MLFLNVLLLIISTHAPAGGATCKGRVVGVKRFISTHAPAGGATSRTAFFSRSQIKFLLTPLREGRRQRTEQKESRFFDFYSRPCGRGDALWLKKFATDKFLLTPLREGRRLPRRPAGSGRVYFYSRPCGRGDPTTPSSRPTSQNFYSRPCGRGDSNFPQVRHEVLRQIAER